MVSESKEKERRFIENESISQQQRQKSRDLHSWKNSPRELRSQLADVDKDNKVVVSFLKSWRWSYLLLHFYFMFIPIILYIPFWFRTNFVFLLFSMVYLFFLLFFYFFGFRCFLIFFSSFLYNLFFLFYVPLLPFSFYTYFHIDYFWVTSCFINFMHYFIL